MFNLCFNTQTIKNGRDTFLIGFAVYYQSPESFSFDSLFVPEQIRAI